MKKLLLALLLAAGPAMAGNVPAKQGGLQTNAPTAHTVPVMEGTSAPVFVGPGAANSILSGNGASSDPAFVAPSTWLDAVFGATQGSVLYRGAATWSALTPGTSGYVLTTQGASANPTWAVGGGGGGGTVSAASAGQLAYYGSAGNVVSGATTGTGVLTALGNTAGAANGFATYNQLGTAATRNTGTSGATVPLLNGANIWGAPQTISTGASTPLTLDSTAANTILNLTNASTLGLQLVALPGAYAVVGTWASTPLIFDINGAEKMRINTAGNVGINKTTPAYPLDVNGAVNATNITTFSPQMYGAICNGSTANASVDTAGFQNAMAAAVLAASNTTAVSPSGVTVDLLGGSCILNAGFTAANPGTGWISTLRVTNGFLRFADAAGGSYFIDLSAIGTVYQASIDHIVFKGENSSGSPNAAGGIKIGEGRGISIHNNVITGFTASGVLQTTSNYGQGLRIDDNFIQAWTGGTEPASSSCVYVYGGDIYIRGNIIADCSIPVYLGLANQMLSNNHIWKYGFTTLTGIVANTGQNIHMTGNYIDTVVVELQGASSGYHFHGNDIVGNHFYMPGVGIGGSSSFSSGNNQSFIFYEPRVSNSGVYQDNISGNAFVNDNGLGGLNVTNNNWLTGSIASGSINGVNITGNTAYGVTLNTSTPLCHIAISSATSASCTMNNIPFGTISSLRSSVMSFLTTPTTLWVTRSGTTVTANLGTSATAQVDVTGSINTDYAQ